MSATDTAAANYIAALEDAKTKLRDEAAKLGMALWPFVALSEKLRDSMRDDTILYELDGRTITCGDLRAAAKAIKPVLGRIDL